MATKKFSRLSIMLEAQDGMSRPLQNAARASEALKNSIAKLGGALTGNARSVSRASVESRVLAERYQELGRRIGGANSQVSAAARIFQSLPAPIRYAAYEIEGFVRGLKAFVTQNVLVRSATTVLSATFNGLRAAISNVTWDIERGTRAMIGWASSTRVAQAIGSTFRLVSTSIRIATQNFMQFNLVGRGLSAIGATLRIVGQGAAETGRNILNMARSSVAFRVIQDAAKGAANGIRNLRDYTTVWLRDLPYTIRATDTFRNMSIAVEQVKQKFVAARLAFELWRNSSRSAEVIANSVQRIVSPLQRVWSGIQRNIQGMRNFNTATDNAGGRGRATFNQLADANARLNRQLEQMNRELERSNSLFGKMKSGISSIASLQKLQMGANMVRTGVDVVSRPIESMLNNAAQQDFARKNFGIIVGDQQKGAQYYSDVQNFAATTQYAPTEWAQQLTSVMKKVKNSDQLNKYMYTMEQLATLMPQQGLEGAAFAMRELAGGQITSLANRFDISKQYLKPIKNVKDPMQQAAMLSDMLGKEYGYSVENVQKMKQSPLMQFQAIKNHASNAMGQMGTGMMNALAPELTQFNKAFSAGKFNSTFASIGKTIGKATAAVVQFGKKLVTAVNSNAFKAKVKPIIDVFKQVADGIAKSWPSIKSTLAAAGSIISKFFSQFSSGKGHQISSIIQGIFKAISKLVNFINDHFNGVEAIVGGLLAGLMAYRAAKFIAPMFTLITKAIRLYKAGMLLAAAAQAIMNLELLAFPGTWIALAIAGVVAAGIYLYKNWDQVSSGMKRIFAAIQRACADMVNGIIGGLNTMIGYVNKIPGVHIDAIGKVSWGYAKNDMPTGGYDGAGTVNGAYMATHNAGRAHRTGLINVPYDGYAAVLHKDERVLTAQENKDYNSGSKGIVVTGNTFIVRQDSDINAIADALYRKLYEAKTAVG